MINLVRKQETLLSTARSKGRTEQGEARGKGRLKTTGTQWNQRRIVVGKTQQHEMRGKNGNKPSEGTGS